MMPYSTLFYLLYRPLLCFRHLCLTEVNKDAFTELELKS